MKQFISLLSLSIILISGLALAREPANLAVTKQQLRRYHDSGAYQNDIANIMQKALRYLELRVSQNKFQGKPAIVLDIDETSLSNYPDLCHRDFGGSFEDIQKDEDQGKDEVIAPTLKLFRFARANHIAVFFVTGRYEEERTVTEANLKNAGFINYNALILRNGIYRNTSAVTYKKAVRKKLTEDGYNIILNIGDQLSDLQGGYADKTFKLPNPYYFIP